jgi:hypothetical protein
MTLDPKPGRFLTAAPTRLCLHMRRGVSLLALALLPAGAVGQGMTTETNGDVLDGEIADLAIQSDATSFPQLKRGWIAQGWARAAIQVSDGARMNAETTTFDWITGGIPERLVALELDDARSYLYTLTRGALYREDVTNPATPIHRTFFNFSTGPGNLVPPLAAQESLLSVRVLPFVGTSLGDSRILVLTSQRLIIMRSDANGLSVIGQCLDVYEAVLAGGSLTSSTDAFFNSHKIKSLASVKVATDSNGLTVAYVQANPGALNFRTAQRAILMLCNLDAAGGFQNAGFDVDLSPMATEYAYWSPFTTLQGFADPDAVEAVGIHDLAIRWSGAQTEVLAACGMLRQLHRLKATFAPNGVVPVSPTPTIVLNPQENLRQVSWDPIIPDRLYVRGSHNFYVVDLSGTPTTLAAIPERANKVDRGDATIVRTLDVGGERRTHWALSHGPEDYNLQAIDVTSTVPVQSFGDGYIERSDGGVALDADNVYVGTGAGVRHYQRAGGVWEQAGYRPASSTALSASGGRFSEQLDLVTIGGAHQILGASNSSIDVGLFAWPLSASPALEPQDGTYFPIPPSVFSTTNSNPIYVNDVVSFTVGGMTYAALCPTRFGLPHGTGLSWDVALVLFRWNPVAVKWSLVASATRSGPQYTFANTVTIADLATPAERVAFVATDTGVMSFSLKQLTSATPQVKFVSEDYAGEVHGIAATPQHLIAAYTHVPDSQRRYAVYSWNQLTGQILANPVLFSVSQLGAPIQKTWKLRYDPLTSSTGDLYDANDQAAFRLRYTADPPSITHLGTWNHQGGAGIVQDCRPYSFGGVDKLLVIKDDQAFAWVIP